MRFHVDCRPQVRIVRVSVRSMRPVDRDQWEVGCLLLSCNAIFLANVSSPVNSSFGVTQKGILGPVSVSAGPKRFFIFNKYSPKAKLILLNNPRDEVEGIIQ